LLLLLLAACNPDYWAFSTGGHGTTAVVVYVSDSPADGADEILVTFASVGLTGGPGDVVLSATSQEVELLALRNGRRALLARAEVRPGLYDALVLRLSSAHGAHHLALDGATHPLDLPPGEERIEIAGPFLLHEGRTLELHLDFNARMSILEAGGRYTLRPQCDGMDVAAARFLEGTVTDDLGRPVAGAIVSAQLAGHEVTSGRTDPDGGFRLGPVADPDLTLVATAPGHGIATGTGSLLLPRADTGELAGAAPGGSYVRLLRDEALIAVAGVDPATGAYAFSQVPAGAYELEVWGPGGLLDTYPAAR
jgi:hypothetical protein